MVGRASLVLGLVATANAFLIPTEVTVDDLTSLSFENVLQAQDRNVELQCNGCPVLSVDESGNNVWNTDVKNTLGIRFTIDQSNKGAEALLVNGVQIFPPTRIPSPLYAIQSTNEGVQNNLPLGYEVSISPAVESAKDNLQLTSVSLQVVEVGGKFVNGLQSVALNVVQTPAGALMIGSLETAATMNPIVNPSECKTLICRWRAAIASKLANGRVGKAKGGCHKAAAHVKNIPSGVARPHFRHGGAHRHGHHGHHHRGGMRFLHALKSVALHIIVPAIIGVAVGLTASLIGMLIGNLIVFLWRALYRRGQPGYYSTLQQEEFSVNEKTSVEELESPPFYEDAPRYEAAINEKDGESA